MHSSTYKVWIGMVGALACLIMLKRPQSSAFPSNPCSAIPPSPMPLPPAGWHRYLGAPTADMQARALTHLKQPLGSFIEDSDGFGYLVEWHCNESKGWHKGVSVFER